MGTRLENVNRAAIYERLTDPNRRDKDGNRIAPLSHLEASYEARDLMDFSNTGSWGMIQYIAQWSPFLNARLQGMYKLGRGALSENQRVQFATTMLAYTMAALGFILHTWMMRTSKKEKSGIEILTTGLRYQDLNRR